ncbi:MAG: hypothetical protein HYX56_01610 [Chloroflexi bacterium]|nr:hypothetical protein [Chloroflexota bacterium]
MPYLSEILYRRVLDASGDMVGRVKDLVISPSEQFPPVQWAIVGTGTGERVLRWNEMAIESAHVRLRRRLEGMPAERIPADAVRLGRDVLDQNVTDTASGRTLQVSDVQLEETGRQLRVMGADASGRGLWRRVGFEALAAIFARGGQERIVPWHQVVLQRGSGSTPPLASK